MLDSQIKAKEPVECTICNVTVQRGSLSWHLKIHEEARFLCDICGVYKTNRKDVLQNHKKVVHNVGEESINDCLFCQKKLPSFSTLEIHLRSHTKERPYLCNFCHFECSIAQYLKNHQRKVHCMKIKPVFPCHICSKQFFDKDCLNKHLKIHLESVEDLPFKCDICSKAFRNRTKLNLHKRVHSKEKPFPCEICNVAFSQLESLNGHMRIHTGEKPFTCKTCQRRFYRHSSLNVHLRVHTGEKPYTCMVCGKNFTQNAHLKGHMMKIHSE